MAEHNAHQHTGRAPSTMRLAASLGGLELFGVAAPALVALGFVAYAWSFLFDAVSKHPLLNGMILFTTAVGVWTAIWLVRGLHRERAATLSWLSLEEGTADRAAWSAQHGGTLSGAALERLGAGDTDINRRKELVEAETASLRVALDHRQELAGYLVGGAVGLGLLGTFIGLLQTLGQMSEFVTNMVGSLGGGGDVDRAVRGLISDLRGPLNSMGTAFTASMLGVGGSVLMGFMLVLARKRVNRFVENFRDEALAWAVRTGEEAPKLPVLTDAFLREFLGELVSVNRRQADLFHQALTEAHTAGLHLNGMIGSFERLLAATQDTIDKRAEVLSGVLEKVTAASGLLEQQLVESRAARVSLDHIREVSDATHAAVVNVGDRITASGEAVSLDVVRVGEALSENLHSMLVANNQALQRLRQELVESLTLNESAYLEAATASHQLPGAVRAVEQRLIDSEKKRASRDDEILRSHAELVQSQTLLKDTLLRLASIQEDVMRTELSGLVALVTDLKAISSGSHVLVSGLDERLTEANATLGRQVQLLDSLHATTDALRMYAGVIRERIVSDHS